MHFCRMPMLSIPTFSKVQQIKEGLRYLPKQGLCNRIVLSSAEKIILKYCIKIRPFKSSQILLSFFFRAQKIHFLTGNAMHDLAQRERYYQTYLHFPDSTQRFSGKPMFCLFQCARTSELKWSTVITDRLNNCRPALFGRCFRPVPPLLVNCTHARPLL